MNESIRLGAWAFTSMPIGYDWWKPCKVTIPPYWR